MDTLRFCVEHGVPLVQIYLDHSLAGNPAHIAQIREFALRNAIRLTCHAPEPLNGNVVSERIQNAAMDLLAYQQEKFLIVHFDETQPLGRILDLIGRINRSGMTVCLENFYSSRENAAFLANLETFNSVFSAAGTSSLRVLPVMDFPRLFIEHIHSSHDSLSLCEGIIDHLAAHAARLILHCIDFIDYDHRSRDTWCAVGRGLVPYRAILARAAEKNLAYDHWVLEFEDKALTLESLESVKTL
jgi:hypothetical protein